MRLRLIALVLLVIAGTAAGFVLSRVNSKPRMSRALVLSMVGSSWRYEAQMKRS